MVTATISYTEEDGFLICHGDREYRIYGTAEGEYSYYYSPGRDYMKNGDPGYPEERELIQESFECSINQICDEDGNEVMIDLTDDEINEFESHMSDCLDSLTNDYDWTDEWEDDDYGYED